VIGFVGDNFSHTRFHGCHAKEGDRALGWSPGQARAHTGEVGVRVGVGVGWAWRRAAGCLGFASLRAARTGMAGWAALFGWATSSRLGRAGVGAGCWVGLGLRPGFGPQSDLLFQIPFLFPNLFIICKLI
jgi:hypothetical protein